MRSVNLNTAPNRMEVSTMRARQGVTGHNVRYVLAFGILGIVVAFTLLYVYFFTS